MRGFDFTTWQGLVSALIGIALFALVGVGIRVLMMLTIQQRQQRMNRQINERLRTLMAAYRVLGGSFTGNLEVDPTHLRELRRRAEAEGMELPAEGQGGGERTRQIRDAVEAALSDIMLLGTDEHVRMAAAAARDLAEGRVVRTHDLVVALRAYIRKALDLEPIPANLLVPAQGPTRPQSGARGKSGDSARSGQGGSGQGGADGGGGGMGMGLGLGMGRRGDDQT